MIYKIVIGVIIYFIFFHHIIFKKNKERTYHSHCWNCKEKISSANNKKCELCGWYICSKCGNCSPKCEQKTLKNIYDKLNIEWANIISVNQCKEIIDKEIFKCLNELNLKYSKSKTIDENIDKIGIAKKMKIIGFSYDESESIYINREKVAVFNNLKNMNLKYDFSINHKKNLEKWEIASVLKSKNIDYDEAQTLDFNRNILNNIQKKTRISEELNKLGGNYNNSKTLDENRTNLSKLKLQKKKEIVANKIIENWSHFFNSETIIKIITPINDECVLDNLIDVLKSVFVDTKDNEETVFNEIVKITKFIVKKKLLDYTEEIIFELNKYSLIKDFIDNFCLNISNENELMKYLVDTQSAISNLKSTKRIIIEIKNDISEA